MKFKSKVWGWTGGLELQVPVCLIISVPQIWVTPIIWEMWGASAESGGTAVVKRESYEGGGSKGKEGTCGNALKLGHGWVLGFGNGV